VGLGRYLCEVRIGQYWRLERLKSFDEFLERRFPECRRKACYIMTIHEHLTRIPKRELQQIGWTKARELVRVARADGQRFDCAPWVHKASAMPREEFIDRSHVEGSGSIGVGAAANSNLTIRQSPVLGSAAAGVQAEGATSAATIDNCELLFNGTAVSSGTNGFTFVGGSKIAFNGAASGGSGSNSSYGTSRIHTNGSNGTFTPISQQ